MSKESRTQIIRLVAALAIALSILVPIIDSAAEKKAADAATSAASAATEVVEAQGSRSPGKNDMANLMAAMHGAASQQPDDAPKDQYGEPYIIGDLGGVAVNLPSATVQFVEYQDSPGWDMDKLRTYRPPVRDYQSVLISFGFSFRNHDKQLYDSKNPKIRQEYEEENTRYYEDDWIRVSVSHYGTNENALDDIFAGIFNNWSNMSKHPYASTGETHYGLQYFIVPGNDPKTGEPWRHYMGLVDDIYVYQNEQGRVLTFIRCANNDVNRPPCSHQFEFPSFMKIRVSLSYGRQNLSKWRELEKNAISFLSSFRAEQKR